MNGWHLKKEVSIGHIATTVIVVVAAFWFFADLDKRVDQNARSISATQDRINRMEIRNAGQFQQIIDRLEKIQEQLTGR